MLSIRGYLNRLIGYARSYRLNVCILQGKEKKSGFDINLFYAGHEAQKNYIKHLIFDENVKEKVLGKLWIWQVVGKGVKDKYNCDLSIIEMNRLFYSIAGTRGGFYVPVWFDGVIDISIANKRIAKSKNIKEDIRKIKKYDLKYVVTKDRDLFDMFYNDMYVPHISRAHGDRALFMSQENMRNRIDNSELLLVIKDGEYVSGSILLYENNEVQGWKHGVKVGDVRYMKSGAAAALYYFEIEYLKQKGYQEINHGGTRAFLKDGVYQVKKKWGMRIGQNWSNGFMVVPRQKTDGVEAFLINNPFMYKQGIKMYGAVFVENNAPLLNKDIKRLHKDYFVPGMEKLRIFMSGNFPDGIDMPTELEHDIEFIKSSPFCSN